MNFAPPRMDAGREGILGTERRRGTGAFLFPTQNALAGSENSKIYKIRVMKSNPRKGTETMEGYPFPLVVILL